MLRSRIFLDSSELVDLRGLISDGLLQSDVVVVMLSRCYFTRPWCLLEVLHARTANLPVVLLSVAGAGFDVTEARKFRHLSDEMQRTNPSGLAVLHTQFGTDLTEMQTAVNALLDRVEAGDVLKWNAAVGDLAMVAQARELIEAMAEASKRPISWAECEKAEGSGGRTTEGAGLHNRSVCSAARTTIVPQRRA
jgi:hypothetical protein